MHKTNVAINTVLLTGDKLKKERKTKKEKEN